MYPKRFHFSFQKLILWPLNWNPNLCFLVEGTNPALWVVLAQFGGPIWGPSACAMGDPAAQNWFSFWSGERSIVFLLSGGGWGCFWEVFGVTFGHLKISFVDDLDKVFVFVRRANVADMDAVIELLSTHILPSPFPRFHIMSICLSFLAVVFVLGVSQFRLFRLLACLLACLSNCLRVRAVA